MKKFRYISASSYMKNLAGSGRCVRGQGRPEPTFGGAFGQIWLNVSRTLCVRPFAFGAKFGTYVRASAFGRDAKAPPPAAPGPGAACLQTTDAAEIASSIHRILNRCCALIVRQPCKQSVVSSRGKSAWRRRRCCSLLLSRLHVTRN